MSSKRRAITDEDRALWRAETMNKSRSASERLISILESKNGSLSRMAMRRSSALDLREKKLRIFLKLLADTLKNIESEDFGKCCECGAEISIPEINAMPWVTNCRLCPEAVGFTRRIR